MVFIKNAEKRHALKSWLSIIFSVFIIVGVFISVVHNLLAEPNELIQEVGTKTFRMFTVLSNMLVAIVSSLCIPFAIDGIRNRNYHLPRWIVNLFFVCVLSVTLTFIISLCILSPNAGFVRMMVKNGNLFLHTLVPIASIILFIVINDYHNIKFSICLYTMIPVFIYEIIYLIAVILVGEENGGWRDHYQFQELMPWPFIAVIILSVSFLLSILIRFGHNYMHKLDKISTEKYYQESKKYDLSTIEDVIIKMANNNKKYDTAGDVIVPRRIIIMLEKKYNSNKPIEELCDLYIHEYLKK